MCIDECERLAVMKNQSKDSDRDGGKNKIKNK